jgi:hypothetical protein
LLSSAFEASAGNEDARISRAVFGLELAFWNALFGEEELAQRMFVEARENFLAGSIEEVRAFVAALDASENPRTAEHLPNVSEVRALPGAYGVMNRLMVTELALAGLASRRGESKAAQRHVDLARACLPADHHEEYFGENGFAGVDVILGKTPLERPFSIGYRCGEEQRCTPDMLRATSYLSINAGYLGYAIADLLERKAYVETIDAPKWRAELKAATDSWRSALFDRDRSLLLGLLETL